MGQSHSREESSKSTGVWVNGKPFRKNQSNHVKQIIKKAGFGKVKPNKGIPDGYRPILKIHGGSTLVKKDNRLAGITNHIKRAITKTVENLIEIHKAKIPDLVRKKNQMIDIIDEKLLGNETLSTISKMAKDGIKTVAKSKLDPVSYNTVKDILEYADAPIMAIIEPLKGTILGLFKYIGNDYIKQGSGEDDDITYTGSYEQLLSDVRGITGGGDENAMEIIGGLDMDMDNIRKYKGSANSRAKEELIEKIINDLSQIGITITGNTNEEKIKSILANIPSQDKLKKDPQTHSKVCELIAETLNKDYKRKYGKNIINMVDYTPEMICIQISDVLNSIAKGMGLELDGIKSNLKTSMENLYMLLNFFDDSIEKMREQIKTGGTNEETSSMQLNSLLDVQQIISKEIERQLSLIQNSLDQTIEPTERDIDSLLDSKNIHEKIAKLNVKPGDEEFSNVIVNLLNGLGITAHKALLIEKALKKVGMTVDEYAKSTSIGEIEDKITKAMEPIKHFEDSRDLLEAGRMLYDNISNSREIAQKISRLKKYPDQYKNNAISVGAGEMDEYDEYEGGLDFEEYPESRTDKRVRVLDASLSLDIRSFTRKLEEYYNSFKRYIDLLADSIGGGADDTPVSDELDGFRDILGRMDDNISGYKNIFKALSGLLNDPRSQSVRDRYMDQMQTVINYMDVLLEKTLYQSRAKTKGYFTAIKKTMEDIKRYLDISKDKFVSKYGDYNSLKVGRGEYDEINVDNFSGSFDNEVLGGAHDDLFVREPKIRYKSKLSMKKIIEKFAYKIRVAKIKQNLKRTSTELGYYSENYNKLVANSIADYLQDEYDNVYKPLIKGVEVLKRENPTRGNILEDFYNDRWETKKKFWATVEAIDAYMKIFTNHIVDNPDDIKDIRSMLDDVEVINQWYDDKSGDRLVQFFEYAPIDHNGILSDETLRDSNSENHYYKKIFDITNRAGALGVVNLGNPDNYINVDHLNEMRSLLGKSMGSIGALKNLLSVFVHIGSKFGDKILHKEIFMSPAQIYKNLLQYIQASAFNSINKNEDYKGKISNSIGKIYEKMESLMRQIDKQYNIFENNITNARGNTALDELKKYQKSISFYIKDIVKYIRNDVFKYNTNETPGVDYNHNYRAYVNAGMVSPVDLLISTNINAGANIQLSFNRRVKPYFTALRQVFKKIKEYRFGIPFDTENSIKIDIINDNERYDSGLNFINENEYFVLMMKAISAKILTVIGLYDVLDRPSEYNGFNPVRMIVGGIEETPTIIEEAVPLYFRLPLLAQFYRNIFNYDSIDGFKSYENIRRRDTNLKITMIPDINGIFSGLINLIFRRTSYIENEAYSDMDIKDIIRECNLIYQRMKTKYPQDTIMETFREFVAEINRRYGLLSKDEYEKYEKEFGDSYDYNYITNPDEFDESTTTEYAILPGEEEEAYYDQKSLSRAERLLVTDNKLKKSKSPYGITLQHRELLYRFRCVIDNYFEKSNDEFSFKYALLNAQKKLMNEQNTDKRFSIVASLIRGNDINTKGDYLNYLIFHETVLTGLNTLSSIYTMLNKFRMDMETISIHDIRLSFIDTVKNTNNGNNIIQNTVIDGYKNHIRGLGYPNQSDIIYPSIIVNQFKNSYDIQTNVYDGNFQPDGNGLLQSGDFALSRLLQGINKNDLEIIYKNKNHNDYSQLETFFRYFIDNQFIMKTLIKSLYGLSDDSQGMVKVSISDKKIIISFGELQRTIENIFSTISYFIERLRPLVSEDLIKRVTNPKKYGSYYWLQENLLYKLFYGRAKDKSGNSLHKKYTSLNHLIQKINRTFYELTRKYKYDDRKIRYNYLDGANLMDVPRNMPAGAQNQVPNTIINESSDNTKYNHYGDIFSELLYYNVKDITQIENLGNDNNAIEVVDVIHNPYDNLHVGINSDKSKTFDTRFSARFNKFYSWDDRPSDHDGLLFKFNETIAKLIYSFYDPISKKIYSNLINPVINGPLNRNITDIKYTYPDVAPGVLYYSDNTDSALVQKYTSLNPIKNTELKGGIDLLKRAIEILIEIGGDQGIERFNTATRVEIFVGVQMIHFSQIFACILACCLIAILEEHKNQNGQFNVGVAYFIDDATNNRFTQVQYDSNDYKHYAFEALSHNNFEALTNIFDIMMNQMRNIIAVPNIDDIGNNMDIAGNAPFDNYYNNLGANDKIKKMIDDFSRLMKHTFWAIHVSIASNIYEYGTIYTWAFDELAYAKRPNLFNNNDIQQRAEIIASVIVDFGYNFSVQRAAINNDDGRRATAINEITNAIISRLGGTRYYVQSKQKTPKMIIKYDELLSADTNNYTSDMRNNLGIKTNYLVSVNSLDNEDKIKIRHLLGEGNMDDKPNGVFGRRGDPDKNHIIFTSLANILKNLATSKYTGVSYYMVDSASDLPVYMKEKIRANLPAFRNIFDGLISYCKLLKQFINNKNISFERYMLPNNVRDTWIAKLNQCSYESRKLRIEWSGILDSIINISNSFIVGCDQTIRDIGDDPKFMEIYQNSHKDYKSVNGSEPLTLISSVLVVYKNVYSDEKPLGFYPVHNLGDDQFKLRYGFRSLLDNMKSIQTLNNMKGFEDLINKFNMMNNNKQNIETSKINDFLRNWAKLLRYVYTNRYTKISGYLTNKKDNMFNNDLVINNYQYNDIRKTERGNAAGLFDTDANNYTIPENSLLAMDCGKNDMTIKPVYSLCKDIKLTLDIVETTNREDKIKTLVEYVFNEKREMGHLCVQNIIDLDIIPINVHALMREIPLINIYNYAYTFDRLLIELYYGRIKDSQQALNMIKNLCSTYRNQYNGAYQGGYQGGDDYGQLHKNPGIESSRDMLVALLLNPYLKFNEGNYLRFPNNSPDVFFRNIMTGVAANGDLGRPKLLSDQLYNKVLLQSLYRFKADYDELGPINNNTFGTNDNEFMKQIIYGILQYLCTNGLRYDIAHVDKIMLMRHANALSTMKNEEYEKIKELADDYPSNKFNHRIKKAIAEIYKYIIRLLNIKRNGNNINVNIQSAHIRNKLDNILDVADDATINLRNNVPMFLEDFTNGVNNFYNNILLNNDNSRYQSLNTIKKNSINNVEFDPGQIESYSFDANDHALLNTIKSISDKRRDSTIIRNLIFIVNLYRSVRLKMHKDLVYNRDIILKSAEITNYDLTEFKGNEAL